MGKFYCAVPQCRSYAGISKVNFHLFPRDPVMSKKWAEILKREKPHTKHSKVCSLHFLEADYVRHSNKKTGKDSLRKNLKPEALPTQNLPDPNGSLLQTRKITERQNSYLLKNGNVTNNPVNKDNNVKNFSLEDRVPHFYDDDDDIESEMEIIPEDCDVFVKCKRFDADFSLEAYDSDSSLETTVYNRLVHREKIPFYSSYQISDSQGSGSYSQTINLDELSPALNSSMQNYAESLNTFDDVPTPLNGTVQIVSDSVQPGNNDYDDIVLEPYEPKYITLQPVTILPYTL